MAPNIWLHCRERSTNFSASEVGRLQQLINKYKDVLFCKKTDGVSTKQKEKTWIEIEKEFNSLGETHRTVKQLKYKFENMKRNIKKVFKLNLKLKAKPLKHALNTILV